MNTSQNSVKMSEQLNGSTDQFPPTLLKLCKAYEGTLYEVISRIVKDDETRSVVFNRAIISILCNGDQFNRELGGLYLWMFKIARKCAVDELRIQLNCPEGYIYTKIDNQRWSTVLSPFLYEIYASFYYFGNNVETTAAHFNKPPMEVMKLLRTATNKIRLYFTPELA